VTGSTSFCKSNCVMNKLCSPHGHLQGQYDREIISHDSLMSAELLKLNPDNPDLLKDMTVAQASQKWNKLGGKSFCRCKHDCMLNKKPCSCIALGILCRDKCTPNWCSNCILYTDIPCAIPVSQERMSRNS
jgi:hypothetical protein